MLGSVMLAALLGARSLAFGGGGAAGGYTAKDYVQSGLIAHWDGIENVGLGLPHDSASTTWKDLVGDLDFRLDTGYFSDDGVTWGSGSCVAYGTKSLDGDRMSCVELILYVPYDLTGGEYGVFFGGGKADNGYSKNTIYIDAWSAYGRNGISIATPLYAYSTLDDFTLPAGTSQFCLSDEYGCKNGVKSTTSYFYGVSGMTREYGTNYIRLGNNGAAGGLTLPTGSIIKALRIYNRALTPAEIAHNYAVDKARFGLP